MKLLYIANIRLPTEKAHGIAILRACEAFVAAGTPVRLVVARRRNPLRGDAAKYYGLSTSIPLLRLPSVDLYGLVPERLAFILQSLSFYISVYVWALFQSRAPVVYTRDMPVTYLGLLGFTVVYECHHIPRNRRRFFRMARRAAKIIVISKALQDAFIQEGFSKERLLVAPSGVSLEVFAVPVEKEEARKRLNLPSKKCIAVYTGNFTTFGQDKGLEDIFKALALSPEVFFAAVGGSDADVSRYRHGAREAGIADRVQLIGHAPQYVLALYQQAADILLMPFPDTPHYRHHMSPVKMFEYMASNQPIIASNLPTIAEVLNERNAFLVPPGDSGALAQTLERVRQNPAEAQTRAAAAATDAGQYSWKRRATDINRFLG